LLRQFSEARPYATARLHYRTWQCGHLPFAARAQKSDGVKRVGVIMGFAENDEVWQAYLSTFRQALQNLGWTEGVTSGSITVQR